MVAAKPNQCEPVTPRSDLGQNRVAGLKDAACHLCGSEDTAPYFSAFNLVSKDHRWDVVRCRHCGLIFMSPLPSTVEDRLRESPPYMALPVDARPSRQMQLFFLEWESRVLRHTSRRRLLDVGCGTGEFWRAASDAGWDAYGVDIHEDGVAAARDFWKTSRLIAGRVDEVSSLFQGSFDVVNLSEVVEHLVDPLAGLRSLALVLRPGGLLTIDVPNVQSFAGWLDRDRIIDVPAHLSYWSSATLRRALETCGYKVVELNSGFGLANLLGRVFAPQTAARIARHLRRIGRGGGVIYALAEPGRPQITSVEEERGT